MNKKDSLNFLNKCLNKLNGATKKDIAVYKTAYNNNCSDFLYSNSFEFVAPLPDSRRRGVKKMDNKTYTINMGNLKVSGSAEDLFALSKVYGLASCEYDHWIDDEINRKNRKTTVIADLKAEQKELDDIGKQIIDTIRDSEFYKKHTSEMLDLIDELLEEIEQEERLNERN